MVNVYVNEGKYTIRPDALGIKNLQKVGPGWVIGWVSGAKTAWVFHNLFPFGKGHLSNEKNPAWLGFYRGWNPTQLYGGYINPF